MKHHILLLSTLLLYFNAHGVFGQETNIFSTSFEIYPIMILKTELGFPLIIGEGETVFLNSFTYLQIFEENMHYGFANENRNIAESIYSFAYNFTWLQQLAENCMLVLGTGVEIASTYEVEVSTSSVLINTLAGIIFFTENNDYYGFGLTYTIGVLIPIPYFNFKFNLTDNIRLHGILPEYLTIGFIPHENLELALKAEMISLNYIGNTDKYSVENPLISLINIWGGVSITINLFEYLFFGIEGGYSVYRSASLIQTNDKQSTNLENALILRFFLTIGLK